MLTPAQVLPFLQHEERFVRRHAARYLAEAHDPSPATADDFWNAMDRLIPQQAKHLLSYLSYMPQTSASCERIIAAMRNHPDKHAATHLRSALKNLDFNLMVEHRDELLSLAHLPVDVREHLKERLELAATPLEELWERLAQHSRDVDEKQVGGFDLRLSDRLIEALVRADPAEAALRALDYLQPASRGDWLEIFCVQLLGKARHKPAIELLVNMYRPDSDYLRERLGDALVEIGDMEVITRMEQVFSDMPWDAQIYMPTVLGRIKRPESDVALLGLLQRHGDLESVPTFVACALCELCTTQPEALQLLSEMVETEDYDATLVDLEEHFFALSSMVGFEIPDAPRRRRELVARLDRIERNIERIMPLFEQEPPPDKRVREAVFESPEAPAFPTQGASASEFDSQPIRRGAPKVGRNDPCPCGSGKKYKKCCMGKGSGIHS
jgi:hypothetical protein